MKHFSFLRKYWPFYILIILLGLAYSLLESLGIAFIFPILEGVQKTTTTSLAFPFNLVSDLFKGMDIATRLQITAMLLVSIVLVKAFVLFMNTVLSAWLQMVVTKYFRMLCFNQLMCLGMGYFNSHKAADFQIICNVYTTNLGALFNLIGTSLPRIFTMIVLLIILFMLSWKMTLVSLVLIMLASLALHPISQKADSVGKLVNSTQKNLNALLLDIIRGMKTIRIFSREEGALNSLEKKVDDYNSACFKAVKIRGVVGPIFESIAAICLAVIMLVGSVMFIGYGGDGVASLLVFILVLHRLLGPAMFLNQTRVALRVDWPFYREVFDFLKVDDKESIRNGNKIFSGLQNKIEFCGATFGYNPKESMVIRDVSLIIPKGTRIGIVGFSGAGKSTLTELIMRFYDPQKGKILIDGIDLRDLDVYSWRRKIGVVSQDLFLFNETLRTNITFAKPDVSQEEVVDAANKAHIHSFIETLPNKYETLVGDRGVLLSGGQRQRIGIARAMITKPEILIFDEATSSLDSESEKIVQQAIEEIGQGRTVITIAHRLSTVSSCDIIFVMEAGNIIEQGAHSVLLEVNGVYKRLVQTQELGVSSARPK
ncbi:MAG: ABC transporter ATP-binding protein [Pseudomonadota bacterium]